MPPGAAQSREDQKTVLAGVLYEKQTAAPLGALIQKLQGNSEGLDPYQLAVIREAKRCEVAELANQNYPRINPIINPGVRELH